jgi:hypothetical protein
MSSSRTLVAALVVALSPSFAAVAQQHRDPAVPAQLSNEHFPLAWVAADLVVDEKGVLRRELLKGRAVVLLEHEAEFAEKAAARRAGLAADTPQSPDGCDLVPVGPTHGRSADSPEHLTSLSSTIVLGRIEAIREGFYHGLPGSLLRIGATYLKGTPANETYVFYPAAKIKLAESTLCAYPPPNYPVPEIGDELLVFSRAPKPAVYDGRLVLWPVVAAEVLYIEVGGRTAGPAALRSLARRGPAAVEAIQAILARAPHATDQVPRP